MEQSTNQRLINRHQHALHSSDTEHDHLLYYAEQDHHNVTMHPHHGIPTIPEGSTMTIPANIQSSDNKDIDAIGSRVPPVVGNLTTTFLGQGTDIDRLPILGGAPGLDGTLDSTDSGGLDHDDNETTSSSKQKQYRYNPANYPVALKLLVSNNVAGSIIGRAGQTISELQTQSKTRIKLSQSNEYYPGTQDRVCLIQGDANPTKNAIRLLLERLHMLQENQHSQQIAWQLQRLNEQHAVEGSERSNFAFDFVVRLLVPSPACGMIIGKSGSNIKFLEESTGVTSVRLSPKDVGMVACDGNGFSQFAPQQASATNTTSERIVTITGTNLDCCITCVNLILDGMILHPDTSRYSNMTTSYSNTVTGNVIQQQQRQQQQQQQQHHFGLQPSMGPVSPDLLMYTSTPSISGSSRSSQALLVQVPPIPRHTSPSPNPPLWESLSGSGPQFAPVGQVVGSSGLTRRIASSPDLHFQSSVHQQKQKTMQPGMMFTPLGSSNMTSDDRLSVSRSTYEMSTVQQYTPSFSQQPLPGTVGNVPMMSSTATHQSVYVIQQQHSTIHGSIAANTHDSQPHRQQNNVPHSASAPNLLAIQFDQSLQLSQSSPSTTKSIASHAPHMISNSEYAMPSSNPHASFVSQTPTMIGPGCFSAQVMIPDSMIGSILGRGGKTLTELQMVSGTRIRISQRGEYIPGTPRDLRIVTIRGPTSQAVWQAQIIISQRIVLPSTASALTPAPTGPYFQSNSRDNSMAMYQHQQHHQRHVAVGYHQQQQQQHHHHQQQATSSIMSESAVPPVQVTILSDKLSNFPGSNQLGNDIG